MAQVEDLGLDRKRKEPFRTDNFWFDTSVIRDSHRKIGKKRVFGREDKCSCPKICMTLACWKGRKKTKED